MKLIFKIGEAIFQMKRIIAKVAKGRSVRPSQAVAPFDGRRRRESLLKNLAKESAMVCETSREVLGEFEKINDEIPD